MIQQTHKTTREYAAEMSLADLVHGDFRFASIFERYGLNYCCKGTRSIGQACAENGLDVNTVLSEIARLSDEPSNAEPLHAATLDEMLAVLFDELRPRLQAMLPPVSAKLERMTASHGDDFPELPAAAGAINRLGETLEHHFARVDDVLLPRVREIGERLRTPAPELEHVTRRLKADVRLIQGYLYEIRELTSCYNAPAGVCLTFSVGYQELAAFDEALSQFLDIEEEMLVPHLLAEAGV